mmetsp:Transcript_7000/g.11232  ORF Transcript_7000/g.11232 Transcript_7000/m.11232 type:complete len:87 (+) Transcript_7000:1148-1408(+)
MYRPKNKLLPQTIPSPATASGRTNMLDPTVFPVINRDADNTLVMASILSLPMLGIFSCGNMEARSALSGKPSSVDKYKDVMCALSL